MTFSSKHYLLEIGEHVAHKLSSNFQFCYILLFHQNGHCANKWVEMVLMYVSYLKMAHDVSVNWSVSPYTVHWIQTPQNILVHTSVCYKTIIFADKMCQIMQSCFRICFEMRLSGEFIEVIQRIMMTCYVLYIAGICLDKVLMVLVSV